MRYRFRFGIQAPEEPAGLNYPCPKFILQPLVENALMHAYREDMAIDVEVTVEDEWIAVSLRDTSRGMSAAELAGLREKLARYALPPGEDEEVRPGIGLQDVLRLGAIDYIANEQFFYEYQPLHQVNHKRAHELQEQGVLAGEADLERLKAEWASLNWVHENELFRQFKLELKGCKLKSSRLYHFLLLLETVWNASYSQRTGEKLSLPPAFHSWGEVEEWLMQAYEKANLFSTASKYSDEVTKNVWQAKQYADTHYASPLDTAQAARAAHMSSGYFSRCFHDIVGETYSDYCTRVRLSHAETLLQTTSLSIQQIAFAVGYDDEKYFSRVFKKSLGMAPSDYRRKNVEARGGE